MVKKVQVCDYGQGEGPLTQAPVLSNSMVRPLSGTWTGVAAIAAMKAVRFDPVGAPLVVDT